jgi:hypothetical protein
MVSKCANPDCGAEFLYLHEGELFVIELPDKGVKHSWLCPSCAPHMRVAYDPSEGAKVVSKAGILDAVCCVVDEEIKKSTRSERAYKASSRQVCS